MGGHVLIPLHFWGAFIGGVGAGVCIGLYSMYVVPETMASLMEVADDLNRRVDSNGCIRYSPSAVAALHISHAFFMECKPATISRSNWLSLVLICLLNEVHYMQQLHLSKKLHHLKEKKMNSEVAHEIEDIRHQWILNDIRIAEWRDTRMYVSRHKISVLQHHELINKFINGMVQNFKL